MQTRGTRQHNRVLIWQQGKIKHFTTSSFCTLPLKLYIYPYLISTCVKTKQPYVHVARQTNGFLSPLKCWRNCGYNTETLCQLHSLVLLSVPLFKVTLHWGKQWQYQLDGKIPCMLHNATHRPMNILRELVLPVGLGPLLWQRHHDH